MWKGHYYSLCTYVQHAVFSFIPSKELLVIYWQRHYWNYIVWHEAKTLFQHPLHQNIISHGMKQSMWIMGSSQTTLKETFISSFAEDNTEKTICLYDLTYVSFWDAFPTLNHRDSPFRSKEEAYWGQSINLVYVLDNLNFKSFHFSCINSTLVIIRDFKNILKKKSHQQPTFEW